MTSYRWLGCDLKTGLVREELPLATNSLPTTLGAYSSATVTMPIPDAPDSWPTATEPGRSLLVCTRENDGAIMWGGVVVQRTGGSSEILELTLASLEAYFDRRYMDAASYVQVDEATIAANLVAMAQVEGVGLTIDAPATGTLRDRIYDGTQDQTIYSQLTELSSVENGPEWTIRLDWNADRTAVVKTFLLRKRLGRSLESPNAVFDFPGTVKDYVFTEDFTSGAGANHVTVFGDGDGERPASSPARDEALLAAGIPRFEIRETFSSITAGATLDAHAREVLSATRLGARTLTISADADTAPQFRADWDLGDDVSLQVSRSYRHPSGLSLIGRVIGLDLDPSPGGSVSPVVLLKE